MAPRFTIAHDRHGRVRLVTCRICGANWRPTWWRIRRLGSAVERAAAAHQWVESHPCRTRVGEAA